MAARKLEKQQRKQREAEERKKQRKEQAEAKSSLVRFLVGHAERCSRILVVL